MNVEDIVVDRKLRVVFMGTPLFSVPVLKNLINEYEILAVVTQPDKKVGRKGEVCLSPIKEEAIKHNILVLQPFKIKEEYDEIISLDPDIIITCAYGQIIPKELLDYPKYGCINVHASLLPKLRGGAPIQRAIMNGLSKTGITIMYMDIKMDAGDIIEQREISILEEDTYKTLHDKLSILGSELLMEVIPKIISHQISPIKQDENLVTYGFNITREDEKLDFSKNKYQIYNQIRGLNGFSGTYTRLDGKIMKVYECMITDNTRSELLNGEITKIYKEGIGVKVANGEIILTLIQPEGKQKMSAISFANGRKDLVGKVFE